MVVVAEKKAPAGGMTRNIGLIAAINIIISVMIGSGIFISPAGALNHSGSVGLCLVIWVACGIISFMGALCFAELGTVIPRSGGEYAYLFEGFSRTHKFWGPMPSFVCSWVFVMILRPAEIAVITLTCSRYAIQPLEKYLGLDLVTRAENEQFIMLFAVLLLGIITFINLSSVKLYVRINNIFSAFKIVACLVVIGGGMYQLAIGNTKNLDSGFEGSTTDPGRIALAFFSGLWAYDGWSSVTTVTEEIKDPARNIPRSIAIAVPIITILYVFMNLSYMTVLSPEEMSTSTAVAVDFGKKILGPFGFIIPVGVALATFGCALSIQFGVTRLCYVAGQEGHFLEAMSYVHVKKNTPGPAVALQGIMTLLFITTADVSALIDFASFLIWVTYMFAFSALLLLRRTQPDTPRPYRVPTVVAVLLLFVALFLAVTPIVDKPSFRFLIALAFILSGVLIYIPFVYYKIRPKIMDKVTYVLQVLFVAAPPPESHDE